MNFLLFILFPCITISNIFASASPNTERYASPPPSSRSTTTFNSPDRTAMDAAIKPSPERASKNPVHVTGAALITASTLDNDLRGAPKHLVEELVVAQGRPFVIICPFLRDPNISHVVLTPTHSSDYTKLVENNTAYQESITEGIEPFLSRNYGTATEFSNKISHLYAMYRTIGEDYLQPLFYKEPKEADYDPDFWSSISFSILGVVNTLGTQRLEVLGDIWLSHFEDLDVVCLKGTSERSTMVGLHYQSTGIGQAAVGIFNTCLVPNWMGKPARLIEPDSEVPSFSMHCFDGIIAYVEPANFKSIGNNFRSHNFLVGAINMGEEKPMLMFRAPTTICTPQHLAVDALKQLEGGSMTPAKTNLFKLWGLVKHLYPSGDAISKGVWRILGAPPHYKAESGYADALAQTNEIIKNFEGFLPEFSETAVAGSPHFPRATGSSLFVEDK